MDCPNLEHRLGYWVNNPATLAVQVLPDSRATFPMVQVLFRTEPWPGFTEERLTKVHDSVVEARATLQALGWAVARVGVYDVYTPTEPTPSWLKGMEDAYENREHPWF